MKDENKRWQLGLRWKCVLDLSLLPSTQKNIKENEGFLPQPNQCIVCLSTHLVPFPWWVTTFLEEINTTKYLLRSLWWFYAHSSLSCHKLGTSISPILWLLSYRVLDYEVFFVCCCDKHDDLNQVEVESVRLVYMLQLREANARTEAGVMEERCFTGLLSTAFSAGFVTHPWTICPRVASPTVKWALQHWTITQEGPHSPI